MSAEDCEPLILSIDTATAERSVAVVRGERVLSLVGGDASRQSSSNVLFEVDAALREAAVSLEEIDLFAAAVGAGSFTGLRSGLATLKGFASTLGRPTVGIPTLHAVGYAARPSKHLIAAIPAGRGEVFAQLLSVNAEGDVSELESAVHIAPTALLEKAARLGGAIKWVGSGSRLLSEQIREMAETNGIDFREQDFAEVREQEAGWVLATGISEIATHVASLALKAYRKGRAVAASDLRAVYVRASDAELKA